MIVDGKYYSEILSSQGRSYLCNGRLQGKGGKSNQSKKNKGKKRESIRSRNLRKMDEEIRENSTTNKIST
ncbi:MAG: hypothetical protein ACMUEL_07925 [Flavobacteriales bacterium Tduv]